MGGEELTSCPRESGALNMDKLLVMVRDKRTVSQGGGDSADTEDGSARCACAAASCAAQRGRLGGPGSVAVAQPLQQAH